MKSTCFFVQDTAPLETSLNTILNHCRQSASQQDASFCICWHSQIGVVPFTLFFVYIYIRCEEQQILFYLNQLIPFLTTHIHRSIDHARALKPRYRSLECNSLSGEWFVPWFECYCGSPVLCTCADGRATVHLNVHSFSRVRRFLWSFGHFRFDMAVFSFSVRWWVMMTMLVMKCLKWK